MAVENNSDFAALQGLLRKPAPVTAERCDFCALPLPPEHGHLVDLTARRIMCGCRPCYLVFEPDGAARGRYKPVPTRYAALDDHSVDDAAWDALQIPIGLAFFFYNSVEKRVIALYPGPAGATESQLSLEAWSTLAAHPVVADMQADVEALVLRRLGSVGAAGGATSTERTQGAARSKPFGASGEAPDGTITRSYLVPIDKAYELVGVIRSSWKGFDGGEEAHGRIDAFFGDVERRAAFGIPRYPGEP